MPVYDFRCPKCKKIKKDVYLPRWDMGQKCECGEDMTKLPSLIAPHIFPADGIFLEHVSSTGERFHSKKEMKDYAKKHDLEIGYLE